MTTAPAPGSRERSPPWGEASGWDLLQACPDARRGDHMVRTYRIYVEASGGPQT